MEPLSVAMRKHWGSLWPERTSRMEMQYVDLGLGDIYEWDCGCLHAINLTEHRTTIRYRQSAITDNITIQECARLCNSGMCLP